MGTTNIYLTLSQDLFEKKSDATYGTSVAHAKGAIEVLSFDCTIEQKGTDVPGKPRSVEEVVAGEFVIKKAVDVRSPKLFFWCCNGEFISEANIECYGPNPAKPYLTYRLTYVHVASYAPSSDGGLPTETIKLKYGQMAVIFDDSGLGTADQGNSKLGSLTNRWSWVMEMPEEMYGGQGLPSLPF